MPVSWHTPRDVNILSFHHVTNGYEYSARLVPPVSNCGEAGGVRTFSRLRVQADISPCLVGDFQRGQSSKNADDFSMDHTAE